MACSVAAPCLWRRKGGLVLFDHLSEPGRMQDAGWGYLAILLMFGLPLIAAAIIGGRTEVSVNRATRELREVAWVGPVPAWRQSYPFKEVGVPLIIPSRGRTTPGFKIEIPVKDHATIPVGYFPTREEAESVAAAIRTAVSPDDLPPFERSAEDETRARMAGVILQAPRGPLG
jgi:hypothetical protein